MKSIVIKQWFKNLIKSSLLGIIIINLSLGLPAYGEPIQISMLAQGDAITDPTSLLRYALPIDNASVRDLQKNIEEIAKYLRGKRWAPIKTDIKNAFYTLSVRREKILASVPEESQEKAGAMLDRVNEQLTQLEAAVSAKDKEQVWTYRRSILDEISQLQELMVAGFPFEVPEAYSNLPQLKGRATIELVTTKGAMTIVADGYSAPVNAGNFVDLVDRGFYDGLTFIRSEENVVQSGDPEGPEVGFLDPQTKEYRSIPLEFLIKGEKEPIYGLTLEEAGIYLGDLVLPFSAYGTVALARPSDDPNGGSSQFFFFKFDREITPPGFNLMDGRYSVFGYLVEGKEVLAQITPEDKIISARIVEGKDNLIRP